MGDEWSEGAKKGDERVRLPLKCPLRGGHSVRAGTAELLRQPSKLQGWAGDWCLSVS